MLTIWGRKTSSNVQALMWCVGELGLDYLRFDVGHRYGGTDSEAFYQLNPNRTVPVLQDDENPPLWETGAILRYLASRYADDAFFEEVAEAAQQVASGVREAVLNSEVADFEHFFDRVYAQEHQQVEDDREFYRNYVAGFEEE